MKRPISWLIVFALAFFGCLGYNRTAYAQPENYARGAVLMDADTLRILYEKDPDLRMPMASTTKVMTAYVAILYGNLNDIVTVKPSAVGVEGSSIYLQKGEKLTLEQLLYGLMLSSGNDAAVAIAEHVGGTVESFVEMMNETASSLGAVNTHFANPNGLQNPQHYTTARDLALISCYAMRNPVFKKIVSTKQMRIPWMGRDYPRILCNKNKILSQYMGGNGIKTGYTTTAGKCLVAAAQRDGMQLVCTVINDSAMFADCMRMLDYGFAHYGKVELVQQSRQVSDAQVEGSKTIKKISLVPKRSFHYTLTKEEDDQIRYEIDAPDKLCAPVVKGRAYGTIKVFFNHQLIAEVPLVADRSAAADDFGYRFKKFFRNMWGNITG